ncbi:MAG TPA: NAD+ synthase [Candidatus Saccharimonadales bacterium]|nr:NAD+ synthase [Candidatus Saccharimonadales bacterium]
MQKINYQQESEKITNWIRKVFFDSGMQKMIVGLSGGIDSAVSCTLASQAIGKEHIIPVLLPYSSISNEGVEDAEKIIDFLGIPKEQVKEINIQKGVDAILNPLSPPYQGEASYLLDKGGLGRVRTGNVMARVRMIYLFDLAKQYRGLVCGTENKSEHYLGYFTRFGDEASDMEPIRHLYKTDVWGMGKYLGLPEKIITKAPTAGLWQGQTDEDELGFSYQQADEVLRYFIDEKLSKEEIITKGIAENIVEKVLQRVKANEFKHHLPFVY